MKSNVRNLAIRFRKSGLSYREILEKVPVAKSTLSFWFRDIKLAQKQTQRLTQKRIDAALRGSQKRHLQKEIKIKELKIIAKNQLGNLSVRERWLIGVALYWAEGSKEKDYAPGSSLVFNNSDPRMIRFYVQWLEKSCHITRDRIRLTLYIHQHKEREIEQVKKFWTQYLKYPHGSIRGVYYKKVTPGTNRKNTEDLYRGTMRVTVSMSSDLSRTVAGWFEAVADSLS